jgi:hypothetical protein
MADILVVRGEFIIDPEDGNAYVVAGEVVQASVVAAAGAVPTSTIYGPLVGCLGGPT